MHKPRIFLCHANEEKPRVEELYHKLKEAGYHPWLDKYDLLPGQKWWPAIKKILGDPYNLVVVCLSMRDAFAADYSYLSKLWEALSPDPILGEYEADYRWLSQVYVSVQPTTGDGQLIWHALGAKTVELIHQHVHVEAVHDDLDEIVLDAELLEAVLGTPDPGKKAKEIEIKVARRLRKHMRDPRFRALSERLEALKERHERGQLHSIQFLKQLLDLAAELVHIEKHVPPEEDEDRGKAALTSSLKKCATRTPPSSWSVSSTTLTRSCAVFASPTGRPPAPASARSKRHCAGPCSSTSCTRTRSCSSKPMAILSNTIDLSLAVQAKSLASSRCETP